LDHKAYHAIAFNDVNTVLDQLSYPHVLSIIFFGMMRGDNPDLAIAPRVSQESVPHLALATMSFTVARVCLASLTSPYKAPGEFDLARDSAVAASASSTGGFAMRGPHMCDVCYSQLLIRASTASRRHVDAAGVNGQARLSSGGGTGMRRNDIMTQVDKLILYVSRTIPFRSGLDHHLIRAAMVFTFFAFSIQKWNQYTIEMLVPLISHSPVVFWLLPAFGVRGAGYFLGTTEMIFGSLIFLGYWSPRLGILGALGAIVTFIGTTSIIPFLPDAWVHEAGGFPIMTLPLGFLMKDVLFLVVSFYLLKQDLTRAAVEIARS
jgi:uncharacterized membrane protein YkgB